MDFLTPQDIKQIAANCGYEERREEASSTIFLKKSSGSNSSADKYPILINVFYTTRGVMTKLSHPRSGYNQLWRSTAYDSAETLRAILINPRSHTGKGYRSACKSRRGCAKCGMEKDRGEFSKNQWRKDPDQSKCSECIQQLDQSTSSSSNAGPRSSLENQQPSTTSLPILFLGSSDFFANTLGDKMKNESVLITDNELIENPSKAKIANISKTYRGVITTDNWFDVDDEYKSIANRIIKTLKEMYDAGGSVMVATTMGVYAVPAQLSRIFEFGSSSSWRLNSYTKKTIITTPIGRDILGEVHSTYTKAHYVQAPQKECLFVEHIDPDDYDSDDYDEPPIPNNDSPVVIHRGPNGGTLSYFGFVNDLDIPFGDIMIKLMNLSTIGTSNGTGRGQARIVSAPAPNNDTNRGTGMNDDDVEIDRACIECDADGCSKSSPSILCSACKMVYYCSASCQRRHKSTHMDECRMGAMMREKAATQPETPKEIRYGQAMAARLAGRCDFTGMLLQAECWEYEENWGGAMECYKSIFGQLMSRSPPEQRQVMMGVSRCMYELGKYDGAIEIGKSAIEMNRHFPQVHKYVALAQKAQGDLAGAKATMTQAVLYETPTWDDDNVKANIALLKEMQQE